MDPLENTAVFLRRLFDKAVEVADPIQSLAAYLPPKPDQRVVVIGAGKASARMAQAVEAQWGACHGLVITRYGYGQPCKGIEIIEAAHPVPDQSGLDATERLLALLKGLGEEDYVLSLISGGASALLVQPAENISLSEKQDINQALLASGAPIGQMNVVRKHLSLVKGGQLAGAAYPARMLSLMISDVPGDDPAFIGSGPTVGDNSTPEDARAILDQWGIKVSKSVMDCLEHGSGILPKGHPYLSKVNNVIYAAPSQSLEAAAEFARSVGCMVAILGDDLEGEARDVAADHAALALDMQSQLQPGDPPYLILSGGELTVTRRGDGIGGPNAEYILALALALNGAENIYALAGDTDGVDGAAEVAGAWIDPAFVADAAAMQIDLAMALSINDAHTVFQKLDRQIVTGPTLTNVNDFRAILIFPKKKA